MRGQKTKMQCDLMNDEISYLPNQPRSSLALLVFNGLGLELTNGEFRQRLLEMSVEESQGEVTSLTCNQGAKFSPAPG